MSLSYFNKKLHRQSKQPETEPETKVTTQASPPPPTVNTPSAEDAAASPVLDKEDEKFFERLAAIAQEPEGTPPPLPTRPVVILDGEGHKQVGKDAQEALMAGADKIPLPQSPPEKRSVASYFALAQSKFKRGEFKNAADDDSKEKNTKKENKKGKNAISDKDRAKAADDLLAAASAAKTPEQKEVEKENEELTAVLDQLNLSAVNNRVFSFSKESEELMDRFKLVLKDLVNGVPTAYNDLESLLTDSENQLKKMYGTLPPFLQNLIKSLPAKMTASLGPELLAAGAEKPGFDAKQRAAASGSATGSGSKSKKSKRSRIPSLKSLVSAEGAVATMLKSILNFLKLRFPALMGGTNVLLSLAVFLLLFVFWYCHKRGRETRLEKEGLAAQEGDSALASSASSITDNDGDSLLASTRDLSASKSAAKEDDEQSASALNAQLPSVLDLPDPGSVPLPDTPAKEKEPMLKSD